MKIELLKNHTIGLRLRKKGEIVDVHPSDGAELVKQKIGIEPHLKHKENGDSRKN